MNTVWPLIVIAMAILWVLDHYFLKAQATMNIGNREEIERLEKELQKERRDAVTELNMIQSRLILFMKLENEIIQKERDTTTEMNQKSQEMKVLLDKMEKEKKFWKENVFDQITSIQATKEGRKTGFPWLAKAYAEFYYLQDMKLIQELEGNATLPREVVGKVKEIAQQRRLLEENLRLNKYLLESYECLFPWLTEFRDAGIDDIMVDQEKLLLQDISDDPIRNWLTEQDEQLEAAAKYQLALDRFLQARKSKWQLDQDYERLLAHEYEKDGWNVEFKSLQQEFPDFLRVLVARRDRQVLLIQPRQSGFRVPFMEKLLLHFFFLGVETFRDQNRESGTKSRVDEFLQATRDGVFKLLFVSAQQIPDSIKALAEVLNITVVGEHPSRGYPPVKGRKNRQTGENRYYLPFDREYDNLIRDERTETYFATVAQAEEAGYKRVIFSPQLPEMLSDLTRLELDSVKKTSAE